MVNFSTTCYKKNSKNPRWLTKKSITLEYDQHHMYALYVYGLKIIWVGIRGSKNKVRKMQRLEICLTELVLRTMTGLSSEE